jgi:hypothetical protein
MEPLSQPAAQDTSGENARNQQQTGLPGNVIRLGVRKKCQQARRRNQRDQTCTLRAMLLKRKK